jgi:threonine/homoserine/homoserine lactone efflux protein
MRLRRHTYAAYAIGCAVVWAIVLLLVAIVDSRHTFHTVLTVFGGWVIGWTSATIARRVYPPPKTRRSSPE